MFWDASLLYASWCIYAWLLRLEMIMKRRLLFDAYSRRSTRPFLKLPPPPLYARQFCRRPDVGIALIYGLICPHHLCLQNMFIPAFGFNGLKIYAIGLILLPRILIYACQLYAATLSHFAMPFMPRPLFSAYMLTWLRLKCKRYSVRSLRRPQYVVSSMSAIRTRRSATYSPKFYRKFTIAPASSFTIAMRLRVTNYRTRTHTEPTTERVSSDNSFKASALADDDNKSDDADFYSNSI